MQFIDVDVNAFLLAPELPREALVEGARFDI